MKLSALTLVVILATSSVALAENNRSFFGDGSPENSYISGQGASANINNKSNLPASFNGRDAFGDGSPENGYTINIQNRSNTPSNFSFNDEGRNGFGDGSPLN
ncbi:hypothetical protein [Bartonella sp. HY038]|uniref:hypothetical protein n=1 Tax=Bartonella sp. HY038 TaxID=2759660 RepID=UPI0015FB2AEA|nr:hypothetical protein [Bartonella sp. HY038]